MSRESYGTFEFFTLTHDQYLVAKVRSRRVCRRDVCSSPFLALLYCQPTHPMREQAQAQAQEKREREKERERESAEAGGCNYRIFANRPCYNVVCGHSIITKIADGFFFFFFVLLFLFSRLSAAVQFCAEAWSGGV